MRLLITRPEREANRSTARLEAMGHEVLCAPIFTIRPTDAPIPQSPYEAVLVTSINGADRLNDLPGWQNHTVYAVGPRTADAVRAHGTPKELIIAAGSASAMIPLVKAGTPQGARLVHVTGIDHKAEPDAALRAAGFDVITWAAYQACAAARLPEAIENALKNQRLDAILHYSRRSSATLLDLVPRPLQKSFRSLSHICLSEDVAAPLRTLPDIRISIASEPSENALFKLL